MTEAFDSTMQQLSTPDQGREFVVSGQSLWEWRQRACQQALAQDVSVTEVDWLLQELAGLDRLALRLESFKHRDTITLGRSLADLQTLWQQRLEQRVPLQYLTGIAPWRNFRLRVTPAVLIPRPETEGLIDLLQTLNCDTTSHWADLGTGSGAIALGLATLFPAATIHAVDTSTAALEVARSNAQSYYLAQRIRFYQGIWLEPLVALKGQLAGLISNPPYIPTSMVPELQPEVAHHEPHLALDGGPDGLDCLRHLIAAAPDYLCSGGIWLVEMMAGQAESVTDLLRQQGQYRDIQIFSDLAGIDRFALAYRR